jgi:hypothetical protein
VSYYSHRNQEYNNCTDVEKVYNFLDKTIDVFFDAQTKSLKNTADQMGTSFMRKSEEEHQIYNEARLYLHLLQIVPLSISFIDLCIFKIDNSNQLPEPDKYEPNVYGILLIFLNKRKFYQNINDERIDHVPNVHNELFSTVMIYNSYRLKYKI